MALSQRRDSRTGITLPQGQDQSQTSSLKDFKIVKKIGEGAFSQVYRVIRINDNVEYALKQVKMAKLSDKEKQNALNEVRILASIQHPNVIAYKEAFFDEASSTLCIVMEFADSGDLYQKILEHQKKGTKFSESEIWNITGSMTQGLKALHDKNILHRDLKCANVFLNRDGTAKMGDLNVSKVANKNGGLLLTQTGTPYYASPEVWKDQPYDYRSDIWSFGCVLYEMIALQPPFQAQNMDQLYKKVLSGQYPPIPSSYSKDLADFLGRLLQVIPQNRPSCDAMLSHPKLSGALKGSFSSQSQHSAQNEENIDLLKTIQMPLNLNQLGKILPKSKYQRKQMTLKLEDINMSGRKQLSNNKNNYSYSQEVNLPPIREIESQHIDKRSNIAVSNQQPHLRALSREASSDQLLQLRTRRLHQDSQQKQRQQSQINNSYQQKLPQAPSNQRLPSNLQISNSNNHPINNDSQRKGSQMPNAQDKLPSAYKLSTPQHQYELSRDSGHQQLQRQMSHQRELVTPNNGVTNRNLNHHGQLAGMIRGAQNVMSAKELKNKYYQPLEQIRKDLSEMSQQYDRNHQDTILHALDKTKALKNYSYLLNNEAIPSRGQSMGHKNIIHEKLQQVQQRNNLPSTFDYRPQNNQQQQQNQQVTILESKRHSQNQHQLYQQPTQIPAPSRNALQSLVPETPRQVLQPRAQYDMIGNKTKRIIISDKNSNQSRHNQDLAIKYLRDQNSQISRANDQNIPPNQNYSYQSQQNDSQNLKNQIKQATKVNFTRRISGGNENLGGNQNIGGARLKLQIDNEPTIQSERGYHNNQYSALGGLRPNMNLPIRQAQIGSSGHRSIPISTSNGAATNRNNNNANYQQQYSSQQQQQQQQLYSARNHSQQQQQLQPIQQQQYNGLRLRRAQPF
eukprot:403370648